MNTQPNRLSVATRHPLRGSEIDRGLPLKFRLNGRSVYGYSGDTVLSAALASGIDTAGLRRGQAIALDERFAPPVVPRAQMQDLSRALPMDRMPAANGLDLATLGERELGPSRWSLLGQLRRAFGAPVRSLGHRFDDTAAQAGPWADLAPTSTLETDLVVVGAGLAGLSAALYAARSGDKVVVIERAQKAGGAVRLFGAVEGEDAPEVTISRLVDELQRLGNVTLLLRTEAFALLDTTVRAHHVQVENGAASGHVIDVKARAVVLAPGTVERLPVFPGNRLPAVGGLLAAFQRAERYGVWLGRSVAFNTAVSQTYRLAMMAHDAGITIAKLSDTRLRPQSRFIEFSKAYGIPLVSGLAPASVAAGHGRGPALSVTLHAVLDEIEQPDVLVAADQFIVGGGWQPDLGLWHVAGGESRWQHALGRLEPTGQVPNVMLAGSAAGYQSNRACLQSGAAAVAKLFLRFTPEVEDPVIEAIYETPDAITSVAKPAESEHGLSYLDGGFSLTLRPAAAPANRLRWWPFRRKTLWPLADQARALSVGDVAAGVQLQAIPEDDAGIVAQERCVIAGDLIDTRSGRSTLPAPAREPMVPAFLAGRFGPDAVVWSIEAEDARSFEAGLLLYPSSDRADPLAAAGVVVGPRPDRAKGALVLIAAGVARTGEQLFVRDLSRPIAVKLVGAFAPDAPAEALPVPAPEPA